jgi:hypothetical protein
MPLAELLKTWSDQLAEKPESINDVVAILNDMNEDKKKKTNYFWKHESRAKKCFLSKKKRKCASVERIN